jgi:hypothetical protein
MDWVRYDAPRISNCKFAITRREMSGGVGKLATGMKPDLPAGVETLRGGRFVSCERWVGEEE